VIRASFRSVCLGSFQWTGVFTSAPGYKVIAGSGGPPESLRSSYVLSSAPFPVTSRLEDGSDVLDTRPDGTNAKVLHPIQSSSIDRTSRSNHHPFITAQKLLSGCSPLHTYYPPLPFHFFSTSPTTQSNPPTRLLPPASAFRRPKLSPLPLLHITLPPRSHRVSPSSPSGIGIHSTIHHLSIHVPSHIIPSRAPIPPLHFLIYHLPIFPSHEPFFPLISRPFYTYPVLFSPLLRVQP